MIVAPMPSGVEHRLTAYDPGGGEAVIVAPMPSGVEHFVTVGQMTRSSRGDRRADAFGR